MTRCPSTTSWAPLQSSCLRGLSVDAQCIRAIAGHPHTLERNDWSSAGSRVAAGERNSRHFHPMTFWRCTAASALLPIARAHRCHAT
jgi:hypothetical protein